MAAASPLSLGVGGATGVAGAGGGFEDDGGFGRSSDEIRDLE